MENWFELPNDELVNYLKDTWFLKSPKLIGQLIKQGNFYVLTEIRSVEFRKLTYPENPYSKQIRILLSQRLTDNLKEGSFYEFFFKANNSEYRVKGNNLNAISLSGDKLKEVTKKDFIQMRHNLHLNLAHEHSDTILKAVKILTSDINREPETFIYELLQNADDYSDKKNVEVKFTLTANYLLLTHNGQPFNFQNVYALTGISQGDKRDNIETIGFKGIGFKSIFKDSNFAIVKSGGFEFKFDETCFTKAAKRPWQIIPVWVDKYDEELTSTEDFLTAPVSIAIKPSLGNDKLRKVEKSYKNILSKVFIDDRILIFLRWIDKVIITDSLENDSKIELNKSKEKWFISSGIRDIEVDESIRNWLNKQIADEEITIPEKYQNIHKTKITFAVERNGSKLSGTTNSKIYNYLPTEIDFGFKFLINGDFIPDGSRTELHNNDWNNYLGEIAGEKFVEWLSILGVHKWEYNGKSRIFDRDYLNLIPDFNNPKALSSGKNTFFLDSFKAGFMSAVQGDNSIKFIPTQSGTLETLSNIFIDETGLAEMLPDGFTKLTTITHQLIHKEVGEGLSKIKSLISEYGKGIIYTAKNLQENLQEKEFQVWLKNTDNNFKFIKHLFNSDKEEIKALLNSEKIVLSQLGELCSSAELFSSIPDELNFIASNKINQVVKLALERAKVELNIKPFNASEFYTTNLQNINTLLINENNILNYWNFIYDNWNEFKDDDDIKKSLSKLNILCKPIDEGKLNIQALGTIYLPKELAKEDEVESIIESLQLKGKHFIETKFETANRPNDKQKWNEIFATAKKGLAPLIKELIPNLNTLEDSLHFKACNEIFKYWKYNKEKPDKQLTKDELTLISQTLKLKCGDTYKLASQCIVSEYFTGPNLVNKIMPSIILKNQINNEYQPIQSLVADWNQFFGSINCIKLNGEQEVFNAKLDYLLSKQVDFQQNHFEIVKEFDSLLQANQTKEIKLSYDFENKFSKFQLQTSTEGIWATARELLFPTEYKPELDLQYDSEVNKQFKFLSTNYLNYASKDFLTLIGVQGNFTFRNLEAPFEFYPSQIIQNKKYLAPFWKFITDSDSNIKKFAQSNVLNTIRNSETIEVSEGVFKKPTDLFSFKLSDYIEDKTLIPKIDFSKYFVDATNTTSLEKSIGINQELNINQCLSLLKNASRISQSEVSSLKIVSIIQNSKFVADDLIGIYLPNSEYQWVQATELFTSSDAEIKNEYLSNLLHTDFNPVSTKLLVSNISSTDFKPQWKIDSDSSADVEIKKAFNERAEYIAFVLRNGKDDYSTTVKQILDSINSLTFIKCDEIYLSILHASLEWKKSKPIHQEKEQVYFVDDLKRKKSDIRSLLYSIVGKLGTIKEKVFYNYLFDESEKAIITQLENNEEAIPQEWIDKLREDNNDIVNSIEDVFEGMDLSDNVKAKLKTKALDIGGNLNEKEQSQHNLVAKFAVIKHLGKSSMIELLDLDDSNNLQIENELYKIFSSRGEFAHIQPTALLQLKNGSCKIAIFYGSKLGVKIFSTIQSLLDLNENYIFEYQAKGDIEKIIDFLERNNIESYRFLLINPAYKNYDSNHFQNMNTEKNEEASNLI